MLLGIPETYSTDYTLNIKKNIPFEKNHGKCQNLHRYSSGGYEWKGSRSFNSYKQFITHCQIVNSEDNQNTSLVSLHYQLTFLAVDLCGI